MQAEVTLIAVIVLLFLYDLIAGERGRRRFSAVACGLLALQVLVNVVPGTAGEVFGGMFCIRADALHRQERADRRER